MNLKPTYPAGANTMGIICAGILWSVGLMLTSPAIALVTGIVQAVMSHVH